VRRFGIEPKVALLSHSNFGSADTPSARKMRAALALIRATGPDYPVDGEMHADSALSDAVRATLVDDSPLSGQANVLVMPSIDAANIAYNMAKTLANGLSVGPVLLGIGAPAHVITPTATSRGVVNMSALAVVGAQEFARQMGSR
jgi:malate dehydrogenase (oxaloacetate-decarboxylating)(NADP+)